MRDGDLPPEDLLISFQCQLEKWCVMCIQEEVCLDNQIRLVGNHKFQMLMLLES